MADAGSIGHAANTLPFVAVGSHWSQAYTQGIGHAANTLPFVAVGSHWSTAYAQGPALTFDAHVYNEGIITGTVRVAGVAAPNHVVMLIERSSRKILRSTAADNSGAFSFAGLTLASEDYMVLVMDEGDTGSYNSKTADRVTAV